MLKTVGQGIARLGRAIPVVLRDATGLAGVGLISYGAWMIMPAAGFIVGGALLLVGAILLSAKNG